MVKNKKGGSSHKKMARKFVNNNSGPRKLRKAKIKEGEIYAKVLQMYGNGMCSVMCGDKVERLCIIRRRFKGRNKRDNMVASNSVLLVGKREWELISDKKKPKVDLLYVYNQSDIKELKKDENFGEIVWPEGGGGGGGDNDNCSIEFTNEVIYEDEQEENVKIKPNTIHNKRINKYKPKVLTENKKEEDDDKEDFEFSFDDI